jgi:hypothetical protein
VLLATGESIILQQNLARSRMKQTPGGEKNKKPAIKVGIP